MNFKTSNVGTLYRINKDGTTTKIGDGIMELTSINTGEAEYQMTVTALNLHPFECGLRFTETNRIPWWKRWFWIFRLKMRRLYAHLKR